MQGGAKVINLKKASDHLPTTVSEQFQGFAIPQEQLYVVTGFRPELNNKLIRKGVEGPHLRFVFPDNKDNFQHTILMLRFYQIGYCNEIYKPEQKQYCITVDPTEFAKINALFAKNKALRRKIQKPLNYDSLSVQQKLPLIDLLFCTTTFTKLEERYAESLAMVDKYSFDSLIAFHKDYLKSSALSFEYLREKKMVKQPASAPIGDESGPTAFAKAITPGLKLHTLPSFPAAFKEANELRRMLRSSV
jgi:hypothetical protein